MRVDMPGGPEAFSQLQAQNEQSSKHKIFPFKFHRKLSDGFIVLEPALR
jgi:hypothetical protein